MFDVCISIVNTKERSEVEQALTTLLADSVNSKLDIGIVVVDNNSNEAIEELENKFPNLITIKHNRNMGFGYSHNRAIEKMPARYYFILNPDTEFPVGQNFLRKFVDYMDAHLKIGLAGPRIFYPDGTLQYSCYRFPTFFQPLYSRTKFGATKVGLAATHDYLMKDFDHQTTKPVDWVMGSAMFLRRSAYEQVGGFDENFFMYAEDSDLCRRLWENGWTVYYVHNIFLSHVHVRASAKTSGVLKSIFKNKFTRIHILSWLKYFFKWRGNRKYYV
ncbi:MAG: hypothetical protein COU29_03415 [Candidatus Magasanikbacteria bacterium CG10_big_fil_rev_8_21_14_0_10_36_32]|uniref:Glycosyltransferase 2-like domain-containing protein n=1 Tax=Candidatus Magasanikbacteria bacterium CG10_big_fil_rev_8_21_14_0_10_36_32 TaxID=1974646 RepID=A0A2M6W662_9BACT|nr:MAG: hypothetical protein COU29_03415 [Candidatus Magasanikbacteria bacterium CG10_big_fil_rev_8_21_14_0_10_36_32]